MWNGISSFHCFTCVLSMRVVLPGPDIITFQSPAFLNLQNASYLYGYLCKGTSIIPSFCWEQKRKCQNIKEKAHSRSVPELKEDVKLTDFNKLWRKTTYLQNDQKEGNMKLYKPCWPNDISSTVLLSKYLDSSGQHLNVICEFEASIKSVWFIHCFSGSAVDL